MKMFVNNWCFEMLICFILVQCKIYMNDYFKDPCLYMIIQIETGLASCVNFL